MSACLQTGLEVLLRHRLGELSGRCFGLVSHPAAVLPDLTGAADALLQAGVKLVALFAPEHGYAGAIPDGAKVADAVEPRSGLSVFSLYGENLELAPEMLSGVDALLFDLQDVGVRFYTYLSTLYYVLRGAARVGKPVIVLDRPNPLNGLSVEGPSVEPGWESFVGILPAPVRHGLTLGELAGYMNVERDLGANLTVIPVRGWQREQWFDDTGLPWVPTSPAMPHLSTAALYPGLCLLEGTNLSEGRGTSLPFEVCGAPWIAAHSLTERLNSLGLPGARFRPVQFIPSASKHAGQLCGGVQVHVTDRQILRPVALGLHLLVEIQALYPSRLTWNDHFDFLAGGPGIRAALQAGQSVEEVVASWSETEAQWRETTSRYRLYT